MPKCSSGKEQLFWMSFVSWLGALKRLKSLFCGVKMMWYQVRHNEHGAAEVLNRIFVISCMSVFTGVAKVFNCIFRKEK